MSDIIQMAVQWCQNQPLIAFAVIVVIAALSWKNPKPMFKLFLIVLAFAVLYSIVSLLGTAATTGIDNKTEIVEQKP